MEVEMIDTVPALKTFLDGLPLSNAQPNLFIDLEGDNLSRHGTLSLITVLVEPRHTVHLVDVHTLGQQAFSIASTNGTGKTHHGIPRYLQSFLRRSPRF